MLKSLSFRKKIMLAVMLTVSIGLAVILGFTNIANSHDARRQGEELARQMAARYAEQTEQSLNSSMKVATLLAQTMEGMRQGSMPSRPTLDALQKRILQTNTGFINIWTLFEPNALDGRDAEFANTPHHDRSGRYVPYFTRKPDGSISQEIPGGGKGEVLEYDRPGDGDYYLVPKQRGVDTVLEPYEYDVAGQKMLLSSFVAPVKDSNGRFIGAAGVDVPLSGVQAALSQVKPFELGYVSVLSNGGVYIANPDAAKLGKPAQDLPAEALAAVKAGKTFSYQAAGNWMHFLTPIHLGQSGTPWAAMVSVPMDEVLAPAVATRNQSLLIALGCVLVLAGVLYLVLSGLLRPLNSLSRAMSYLSSGSGDLTRRMEVTSQDEIGKVAEAFNAFVGQLHSMFSEVRQHAEQLGKHIDELGQVSGQVADGSQRQAEAASATAATIEEVTTSITHIADSARDAEQVVNRTVTFTRESAQVVERSSSEIGQIAGTVRHLNDNLAALESRSTQINAIVNVIRDVADQTNLLALNAAIEAARAGEQGRGFAVVADEVRKLAERTGQATVEISGMITAIQQDTRHAAGEMSVALTQVNQGVELAQQAAQSIASIHGNNSTLIEKIHEIANATAEQSLASTDIARNAERISSMAADNDGAVQHSAQATRQAQALAASLREIVSHFKL